MERNNVQGQDKALAMDTRDMALSAGVSSYTKMVHTHILIIHSMGSVHSQGSINHNREYVLQIMTGNWKALSLIRKAIKHISRYEERNFTRNKCGSQG